MSMSRNLSAVQWPPFVGVPAERVIDGSPETSTAVLHSDAGAEFGFWQCTPGSFASSRDGYSEFVYIVSGAGEIVGDDGTVFPLVPGETVYLADGWRGRWVIRETVTKSYAIDYSA